MRTKVVLVTAVLLMSSAAFGASAFTSTTIDRSSSIQVTTDANSLVALEDGTSGSLVEMTSSNELEIKLDNETSTTTEGVNIDSRYELGNPSSADTQSAFNITNNGEQSYTLDLSYTGDDDSTSGEYKNVRFKIYNSTGSLKKTVTEEDSSATSLTVNSGETFHVVLVVDTTGSDVSSGTSLGGQFQIRV